MLYLIGLGITDERAISLEAIDIAKKSECFIETYTSKWQGNLENLEKIIDNKIKQLQRSDLEENSQKLLDLAKKTNVTVFTIGDPLSATTHVSFLLDAKKQKIPYKIIHNASIFTAIAETGLSLYNFGKTATIPFSKQLENVKNTIENNQKIGLHTLLLLDIEMTVERGIEILLEAKLLEGKVIGLHIPDKIKYDLPENLKNIGNPSVLIIPGKLNSIEKEFLEYE